MLNKFKKLIALVIVGLLFGFGGIFNVSAASYYNEAYYSQAIPSGYYDDVEEGLTGQLFRENLQRVISKGVKVQTYKSLNDYLKYTDPDPKSNGNIICFYTGRSLNGGWNKEHVWAKSHGISDLVSNGEAYSDAHHLRPTLTNINSTRGNKDFGEVSGGSEDGFGNKWTNSIFEPRDEVKGDVARIMFYMATMYGSNTRFNLTLVYKDNTSTDSSEFGNLETLLKWHYQDPVSKEEIYRNNAIYDFQNNRNPYIDHPEYVKLAYPNDYKEPDTPKPDIPVNPIEPVDPVDPIEPITPIEGDATIEIDLTSNNMPQMGYTKDIKFTSCNYTFNASAGGSFSKQNGGSVVRIGDKSNESVDSKYGIGNVTGVSLETNIDLSNVCNISLSFYSTYGTINGWYILSEESGVYKQLAKGSGSVIEANLGGVNSGKLVFIVYGNTVRCDLQKLTLEVKENKVTFGNIECLSGININYTESDTYLSIRFGGYIDEANYHEDAKYGVIVLEGEFEEIFQSGLQEATSVKEDIGDGFYKECSVAKTEKGYELSWEISNSIGSYDESFFALIYMEYDGKLYYSIGEVTSVNDLIEYYQVNQSKLNLPDWVIELLK